ncbi:DUF1707 and DUF4870 domain-containing protein [Streptosporangium sp. KLBMP 9127]|nr:DUF1707 and DUF4870 domain-containing protein [Streptosporangium sp. KLBMP 9127]
MSDDDREQVVEHIKSAYADGRLDKDEFDERVDRAMTALTHADLRPIMDELYGTRNVPQPMPRSMPRSMPQTRRPVPPNESNDRLAAGAAHLLPLCGLFFLGPLIMLLTAGKTSPYVREHAVESLNFQLTLLLATIALPFTVIGIVLIPVIWVAAFVLVIIGGASALGAGQFRYPLTLRMIK